MPYLAQSLSCGIKHVLQHWLHKDAGGRYNILFRCSSVQGALCSDGHLRQEPHGTLCCPYFALVLAGGQLVVLLHHVHAKKRLQKTSAL